ncbi:conserved hypothetical protein [Neospora caninum Liverpool]|uniref:Autophagy-related cysteine peptidase atg4,putative n=1 Tax=Neospora caninum (strain Liverpool) TaxID=572307 RepID=F0VAX9_NEOCL|nr:conserved hypothetical protein [Neospora caninum Liverpool]CBZ51355.1 conserved hypothetical protein [Neospora caninum Liverpool]CEL68673.1 TPA: autophagy-related cysteine peptidase atg4,putative [Neospora caninum Liverpool]|eukprot:XP_003881388.1 conserved hypothetical protein [Neospora caninum Liverpool]
MLKSPGRRPLGTRTEDTRLNSQKAPPKDSHHINEPSGEAASQLLMATACLGSGLVRSKARDPEAAPGPSPLAADSGRAAWPQRSADPFETGVNSSTSAPTFVRGSDAVAPTVHAENGTHHQEDGKRKDGGSGADFTPTAAVALRVKANTPRSSAHNSPYEVGGPEACTGSDRNGLSPACLTEVGSDENLLACPPGMEGDQAVASGTVDGGDQRPMDNPDGDNVRDTTVLPGEANTEEMPGDLAEERPYRPKPLAPPVSLTGNSVTMPSRDRSPFPAVSTSFSSFEELPSVYGSSQPDGRSIIGEGIRSQISDELDGRDESDRVTKEEIDQFPHAVASDTPDDTSFLPYESESASRRTSPESGTTTPQAPSSSTSSSLSPVLVSPLYSGAPSPMLTSASSGPMSWALASVRLPPPLASLASFSRLPGSSSRGRRAETGSACLPPCPVPTDLSVERAADASVSALASVSSPSSETSSCANSVSTAPSSSAPCAGCRVHQPRPRCTSVSCSPSTVYTPEEAKGFSSCALSSAPTHLSASPASAAPLDDQGKASEPAMGTTSSSILSSPNFKASGTSLLSLRGPSFFGPALSGAASLNPLASTSVASTTAGYTSPSLAMSLQSLERPAREVDAGQPAISAVSPAPLNPPPQPAGPSLFRRVRSLRQLQQDVTVVFSTWTHTLANWAAPWGAGPEEGGCLKAGERAVVLGKLFWVCDEEADEDAGDACEEPEGRKVQTKDGSVESPTALTWLGRRTARQKGNGTQGGTTAVEAAAEKPAGLWNRAGIRTGGSLQGGSISALPLRRHSAGVPGASNKARGGGWKRTSAALSGLLGGGGRRGGTGCASAGLHGAVSSDSGATCVAGCASAVSDAEGPTVPCLSPKEKRQALAKQTPGSERSRGTGSGEGRNSKRRRLVKKLPISLPGGEPWPAWRIGCVSSDVEEVQQQLSQTVGSIARFTYRSGFSPMYKCCGEKKRRAGGGFEREWIAINSDVGWGCTVRAAQMLLMQALRRHFLGVAEEEGADETDGRAPGDASEGRPVRSACSAALDSGNLVSAQADPGCGGTAAGRQPGLGEDTCEGGGWRMNEGAGDKSLEAERLADKEEERRDDLEALCCCHHTERMDRRVPKTEAVALLSSTSCSGNREATQTGSLASAGAGGSRTTDSRMDSGTPADVVCSAPAPTSPQDQERGGAGLANPHRSVESSPRSGAGSLNPDCCSCTTPEALSPAAPRGIPRRFALHASGASPTSGVGARVSPQASPSTGQNCQQASAQTYGPCCRAPEEPPALSPSSSDLAPGLSRAVGLGGETPRAGPQQKRPAAMEELLQWFLDVPSPPGRYPFSIFSFIRAAGGGIGWARQLYGELCLEQELFGTGRTEKAWKFPSAAALASQREKAVRSSGFSATESARFSAFASPVRPAPSKSCTALPTWSLARHKGHAQRDGGPEDGASPAQSSESQKTSFLPFPTSRFSSRHATFSVPRPSLPSAVGGVVHPAATSSLRAPERSSWQSKGASQWELERPPASPHSEDENPLERRGLGKFAGEWFGPATASSAVKLLVEAMPQTKDELYVYVNSDGLLYPDEILLHCRGVAGGSAGPSPFARPASLGGLSRESDSEGPGPKRDGEANPTTLHAPARARLECCPCCCPARPAGVERGPVASSRGWRGEGGPGAVGGVRDERAATHSRGGAASFDKKRERGELEEGTEDCVSSGPTGRRCPGGVGTESSRGRLTSSGSSPSSRGHRQAHDERTNDRSGALIPGRARDEAAGRAAEVTLSKGSPPNHNRHGSCAEEEDWEEIPFCGCGSPHLTRVSPRASVGSLRLPVRPSSGGNTSIRENRGGGAASASPASAHASCTPCPLYEEVPRFDEAGDTGAEGEDGAQRMSPRREHDFSDGGLDKDGESSEAARRAGPSGKGGSGGESLGEESFEAAEEILRRLLGEGERTADAGAGQGFRDGDTGTAEGDPGPFSPLPSPMCPCFSEAWPAACACAPCAVPEEGTPQLSSAAGPTAYTILSSPKGPRPRACASPSLPSSRVSRSAPSSTRRRGTEKDACGAMRATCLGALDAAATVDPETQPKRMGLGGARRRWVERDEPGPEAGRGKDGMESLRGLSRSASEATKQGRTRSVPRRTERHAIPSASRGSAAVRTAGGAPLTTAGDTAEGGAREAEWRSERNTQSDTLQGRQTEVSGPGRTAETEASHDALCVGESDGEHETPMRIGGDALEATACRTKGPSGATDCERYTHLPSVPLTEPMTPVRSVSFRSSSGPSVADPGRQVQERGRHRARGARLELGEEGGAEKDSETSISVASRPFWSAPRLPQLRNLRSRSVSVSVVPHTQFTLARSRREQGEAPATLLASTAVLTRVRTPVDDARGGVGSPFESPSAQEAGVVLSEELTREDRTQRSVSAHDGPRGLRARDGSGAALNGELSPPDAEPAQAPDDPAEDESRFLTGFSSLTLSPHSREGEAGCRKRAGPLVPPFIPRLRALPRAFEAFARSGESEGPRSRGFLPEDQGDGKQRGLDDACGRGGRTSSQGRETDMSPASYRDDNLPGVRGLLESDASPMFLSASQQMNTSRSEGSAALSDGSATGRWCSVETLLPGAGEDDILLASSVLVSHRNLPCAECASSRSTCPDTRVLFPTEKPDGEDRENGEAGEHGDVDERRRPPGGGDAVADEPQTHARGCGFSDAGGSRLSSRSRRRAAKGGYDAGDGCDRAEVWRVRRSAPGRLNGPKGGAASADVGEGREYDADSAWVSFLFSPRRHASPGKPGRDTSPRKARRPSLGAFVCLCCSGQSVARRFCSVCGDPRDGEPAGEGEQEGDACAERWGAEPKGVVGTPAAGDSSETGESGTSAEETGTSGGQAEGPGHGRQARRNVETTAETTAQPEQTKSEREDEQGGAAFRVSASDRDSLEALQGCGENCEEEDAFSECVSAGEADPCSEEPLLDGSPWRRGCLLLFPLTLCSGEKINPVYVPSLLAYLELPWSVGMVAGRGQQAFYCIGTQQKALLYLDPHSGIQPPALQLPSATPSFFAGSCWKIADVAALNPSLSVAFFVRSGSQLAGLMAALKQIETTDPYSMLQVVARRPSPSSLEVLDGDDDAFLPLAEAEEPVEEDVLGELGKLADGEERGATDQRYEQRNLAQTHAGAEQAETHAKAPAALGGASETGEGGHQMLSSKSSLSCFSFASASSVPSFSALSSSPAAGEQENQPGRATRNDAESGEATTTNGGETTHPGREWPTGSLSARGRTERDATATGVSSPQRLSPGDARRAPDQMAGPGDGEEETCEEATTQKEVSHAGAEIEGGEFDGGGRHRKKRGETSDTKRECVYGCLPEATAGPLGEASRLTAGNGQSSLRGGAPWRVHEAAHWGSGDGQSGGVAAPSLSPREVDSSAEPKAKTDSRGGRLGGTRDAAGDGPGPDAARTPEGEEQTETVNGEQKASETFDFQGDANRRTDRGCGRPGS